MFGKAFLIAALSINFSIPQEYQHGTTVTVHFVDTQEEIDAACGPASSPDLRKLGCETPNNEIVVGNPCHTDWYPDTNDNTSFAHLMCHEKAHVNGWRHAAS